MLDFVASAVEQLRGWSGTEETAVVLAIAYLILAIRENIWCWLCAMISTAIYVYLFVQAKLYMEAVLNMFYFGMAVYGWFIWRGDESHEQPNVTVWPLSVHMAAIGGIAMLSTGSGYLLSRYTDAAFPYMDSMTTYAGIWATFLVARKVLENWWYWLAIDLVSVVIYWSRGLELTALLFVVYVLMIPFGLLLWSRSLREQRETVAV